MKRTKLSTALFAVCSILMLVPSCAYLQTHKNIREIGAVYDGFSLESPDYVYRKGDQWYLAARKCKMKKEYPILRDRIMFTELNQDTVFVEIRDLSSDQAEGSLVYLPVSSTTAQVLRAPDGYFTREVLLQEALVNYQRAVPSLSGKTAYPVLASIHGKQYSVALEESRSPRRPCFALNALSQLDRVVIDWPCSVAYNVCMPLMAPFIFFWDFSTTN